MRVFFFFKGMIGSVGRLILCQWSHPHFRDKFLLNYHQCAKNDILENYYLFLGGGGVKPHNYDKKTIGDTFRWNKTLWEWVFKALQGFWCQTAPLKISITHVCVSYYHLDICTRYYRLLESLVVIFSYQSLNLNDAI